MTDPNPTTPAPVSVPVDAILDGFRAALAEYAGAATARALERAIIAEAAQSVLLADRDKAEAQRKPTTEVKD